MAGPMQEPKADRAALTRQGIYDLVWSRPVVEVATELGLSDVGLRKLCRRNAVPLPPRGYWQRRKNGHPVRQPALPHAEHADALLDASDARLGPTHARKPWGWATPTGSPVELATAPAPERPESELDPPAEPERTTDPSGPRRRAVETGPDFPRVSELARRAATDEEIRPLYDLCRDGRLFEVQDWIAAGKPVNPPLPKKGRTYRSALGVAVERGFHSLVEILLQAGAAMEPVGYGGPMADAIESRRLDLVKLMVEHGYDVGSIDMRNVFTAWAPEVMKYLIESGAEVERGNPLAFALCQRVRTALGIFKTYRQRFPSFIEQANIALRHHCREGDAKWVSLLLWAGADPYAPGVDDPDDEPDPDEGTSGVVWAAVFGHFDLFRIKTLRLLPDHPDTREVLYYACSKGQTALIERLLSLGLRLNDREDGGCSTIQTLIERLSFLNLSSSWGWRKSEVSYYQARSTIDAVELLAARGARWVASKSEIASARQSLLKTSPEAIFSLIRALAKHSACSRDTACELLRTPRIRSHLEKEEARLRRLVASLP